MWSHIREVNIVRYTKRLLLKLYFTPSVGTLSVLNDLLFLNVLDASLISSKLGASSLTSIGESLRYSKWCGFANSGGSSSSLSEEFFLNVLLIFL